MSNYESKKMPLIDSKDAVLLIVDMQDKLFKAMSEKEVLISNVLKLLKFSRIMDIPVVVTEQQQLGNTLYGRICRIQSPFASFPLIVSGLKRSKKH